MKFRSRLLLALIPATAIPVVALALLVRAELTELLRRDYEARADALVYSARSELARQGASIRRSLKAIASAAGEDGRLRRAIIDRDPAERGYLLDYGARAMAVSGLSVFRLLDTEGTILTSGHFRNEYDGTDTGFAEGVLALGLPANGLALAGIRSPDAPLLAAVRAERMAVAGRDFTLLGGDVLDSEFLRRLGGTRGVDVTLLFDGAVMLRQTDSEPSSGLDLGADDATRSDNPADNDATRAGEDVSIPRSVRIPYVSGGGAIGEAEIEMVVDLTDLRVVQATVDRWLVVVFSATLVLMVLIVTWLASGLSRPLLELADKTSRLDLDRLTIGFKADRRDEIGLMSRTLGALAGRLRASRITIRNAERRATLGEMARQVNHDIKNGLAPIRNVLRHFAQVAAETPAELPRVFEERRETLEASVGYLEELASNYARLSPRIVHKLCDVNEVVQQVAADAGGVGGPAVRTHLLAESGVRSDPVALRRILENLVDNAIRSLDSESGSVVISTESALDSDGGSRVRIRIQDTGVGMSAPEVTQAFNDFYTPRDGGTGLGLSIVRRLVTDLGGTIRIESEKGKGTLVTVDLPSAESPGQ
jgi:signal transduction histidine kinase